MWFKLLAVSCIKVRSPKAECPEFVSFLPETWNDYCKMQVLISFRIINENLYKDWWVKHSKAFSQFCVAKVINRDIKWTRHDNSQLILPENEQD